MSRRIASSRFCDRFQIALAAPVRDRRRSARCRNRPSPSDRARSTPSRWRRAAGPAGFCDQYQTSSAPTFHGVFRQPYQPSAPCIVGYCLAPVDLARVRVDRVDHGAPGIDVFLIAGDEQRVAEPDQRPRNPIAVFAPAGDRIDRAESPAIGVAPPLAFRAADLAVEIDEARNDAAVLASSDPARRPCSRPSTSCTSARPPADRRSSAASSRPDSGSDRRRRRCIPRSGRGTARTSTRRARRRTP